MPVTNGTKKTVPAARAAANEQTPSAPEPKQGFGLAQALVIGFFLAAAVILRLVAKMDVNEIGILLCWAGGIGVLVIAACNVGGGGGPRRLLRRILSAAAGNPTN
ncbi:hypothetical protein ACFU3J_16190 [Streptomyces sp. NPDC057411]|uniref:hypothetical protein n=1 Tax=unclassified Streptomyces TaxID=2593676 RepID=UPI003628B821